LRIKQFCTLEEKSVRVQGKRTPRKIRSYRIKTDAMKKFPKIILEDDGMTEIFKDDY
jgi:hypothetical protein